MCKYPYVRRYEGTDKQTELIYSIKDKRQSKVLRIPSPSSVQISIPKRKIFGKYMGSCNDQHNPRLYEIKKCMAAMKDWWKITASCRFLLGLVFWVYYLNAPEFVRQRRVKRYATVVWHVTRRVRSVRRQIEKFGDDHSAVSAHNTPTGCSDWPPEAVAGVIVFSPGLIENNNCVGRLLCIDQRRYI